MQDAYKRALSKLYARHTNNPEKHCCCMEQNHLRNVVIVTNGSQGELNVYYIDQVKY